MPDYPIIIPPYNLYKQELGSSGHKWNTYNWWTSTTINAAINCMPHYMGIGMRWTIPLTPPLGLLLIMISPLGVCCSNCIIVLYVCCTLGHELNHSPLCCTLGHELNHSPLCCTLGHELNHSPLALCMLHVGA
jgi:hypothetical protein